MEELQNKSIKELMPYILACGGAVLTLIGCFLPFFSILGFSVSFAQGGLHFIIVLFALLAWGALAAVEFLKKMPLLRWGVIPAGLALADILYNAFSGSGIGVGGLSIGAFVLIIGAAAGVASGVLGFLWKTGEEQGQA